MAAEHTMLNSQPTSLEYTVRFWIKSNLFFTETGWPMTTHSVGLGMPNDYPFGTCGRPCPGWDGKNHDVQLIK